MCPRSSMYAARGGLRWIAEQVAGPRTERRRAVSRVGQAAAIEGQAAAADAVVEAPSQSLELGDAVLDPLAPTGGQARPVGPGGDAVGREPGQLGRNLHEGQAHTLGKD